MEAITINHMDRILTYLEEHQLEHLKETLISECKEIAVNLMESTNDYFEETMRTQYKYKRELVRRVMIAENVRFDKSNDTNGRII